LDDYLDGLGKEELKVELAMESPKNLDQLNKVEF